MDNRLLFLFSKGVSHIGTSRLQYPFLQLEPIGGCMLLLAMAAWLPSLGRWTVAALRLVMFAAGWLSVEVKTQIKTTIQLFVEPSYLGKVLGMSTSISFVLIPLSLVIAGECWSCSRPSSCPCWTGDC